MIPITTMIADVCGAKTRLNKKFEPNYMKSWCSPKELKMLKEEELHKRAGQVSAEMDIIETLGIDATYFDIQSALLRKAKEDQGDFGAAPVRYVKRNGALLSHAESR
jgi:hypothetical protein